MPVHIGGFISRHIYDGKLQTVHSLKARSVCRLVDIQRGKEEQAGKSWIVRPCSDITMTVSDVGSTRIKQKLKQSSSSPGDWPVRGNPSASSRPTTRNAIYWRRCSKQRNYHGRTNVSMWIPSRVRGCTTLTYVGLKVYLFVFPR